MLSSERNTAHRSSLPDDACAMVRTRPNSPPARSQKAPTWPTGTATRVTPSPQPSTHEDARPCNRGPQPRPSTNHSPSIRLRRCRRHAERCAGSPKICCVLCCPRMPASLPDGSGAVDLGRTGGGRRREGREDRVDLEAGIPVGVAHPAEDDQRDECDDRADLGGAQVEREDVAQPGERARRSRERRSPRCAALALQMRRSRQDWSKASRSVFGGSGGAPCCGRWASLCS